MVEDPDVNDSQDVVEVGVVLDEVQDQVVHYELQDRHFHAYVEMCIVIEVYEYTDLTW